MVATRWSSLAVALLLLAPSSQALAKDHDDGVIVRPQVQVSFDHDRDDRWRHDRDDDRRRDERVSRVAFDNGYSDGFEKGVDDGRHHHSFDPTRHKWFRSGDRHYDSRFGPRAEYENLYRDGFRNGYQAGYADGDRRDGRPYYGAPRPY